MCVFDSKVNKYSIDKLSNAFSNELVVHYRKIDECPNSLTVFEVSEMLAFKKMVPTIFFKPLT